MKSIKYYLIALSTLIFITACDEDQRQIEDQLNQNPLPSAPTGDPGELSFSKYVSIGNSIAAGYQDGALYTNAQERNFASFLATQLQISGVGGGAFNQPDINSINGFSSANPDPSNGLGDYLGRFQLSLSLLRPVPTAGELPPDFGGTKSTLNNFAVPGMKVVDAADPTLAVRNPLYGRFASSPGISTVLGDALAASPTFFTFELGANDVLGYATSGGLDETDITGAVDFQTELSNSLGALAASGAKGVVVHIPMMLTTPFFRAVPYNAVPLDATTAATLNGAFAAFNQAMDGIVGALGHDAADANRRKVNYVAGPNPLLIFDDALEDLGPKFDILMGAGAITPAQRAALDPFRQSRPAVSGDLPLLTAAGEIQRVIGGNPLLLSGISYPIGDRFILTQAEQVNVVTARATFNAIISGVVQAVNAGVGSTALVEYDVNVQMADIAGLTPALATQLALSPAAVAGADGVQGIIVDGVSLAPDFSPNGVFSTDGIHPNPRGHGIVTNAIIDLINSSFGASIPKMNVLALRSILTTD